MTNYVNRNPFWMAVYFRSFAQKSNKKFVKIIRKLFQKILAFLLALWYYSKARCENAA